MALILNIETATKNCSVSLAKDGKIAALQEFAGEGYLHAEKLHVFIQEVLRESKLSFKDLSAVGISMGPGSYTGLRIGVSAAKGLCYTLNIPLLAVNTLELLARKIEVDTGVIVPMIDARRMEVYSAVFDKNYNLIREVAAEIINEDSFAAYEMVHLAGDGATKCKNVLNSGRFVFHDEVIYPSAAEMAILSYNKYKISDTVDVAYFEPYYLKDFIVGK